LGSEAELGTAVVLELEEAVRAELALEVGVQVALGLELVPPSFRFRYRRCSLRTTLHIPLPREERTRSA